MTQQRDEESRYSFEGEGARPGGDDMEVAKDDITPAPQAASGDPQQVDPGGYPHAPSPDVPSIPTDVHGGSPGEDLPQPEEPAGPGQDNAQTKPANDQELREQGSA
ncbi:MAG: hypothetical protein ACLGIA_11640 [Actinomycetes bacterium]